jgi:hypothetical protein
MRANIDIRQGRGCLTVTVTGHIPRLSRRDELRLVSVVSYVLGHPSGNADIDNIRTMLETFSRELKKTKCVSRAARKAFSTQC